MNSEFHMILVFILILFLLRVNLICIICLYNYLFNDVVQWEYEKHNWTKSLYYAEWDLRFAMSCLWWDYTECELNDIETKVKQSRKPNIRFAWKIVCLLSIICLIRCWSWCFNVKCYLNGPTVVCAMIYLSIEGTSTGSINDCACNGFWFVFEVSRCIGFWW